MMALYFMHGYAQKFTQFVQSYSSSFIRSLYKDSVIMVSHHAFLGPNWGKDLLMVGVWDWWSKLCQGSANIFSNQLLLPCGHTSVWARSPEPQACHFVSTIHLFMITIITYTSSHRHRHINIVTSTSSHSVTSRATVENWYGEMQNDWSREDFIAVEQLLKFKPTWNLRFCIKLFSSNTFVSFYFNRICGE